MSRLAASVLLLAGCVADLGSPTLVDDTRVLAVRAEVEGHPDRASPAPGESVRLTFLVAHETAPRPVGFHLVASAAGEPFAETASEPTTAPPSFDLVAPAAPELTVRGIFCPDAAADGPDGCAGSAALATRVRYSLAVTDTDPNRNPTLADVRLGDADWPEAPLPNAGSPCDAGTGLPTVQAGGGPTPLSFTAGPFDPDEELQVSHHATAGDLSPTFSFLSPGAERGEARWAPPDDRIGVVRFWLVALDRRGGTGWVERAACVVP